MAEENTQDAPGIQTRVVYDRGSGRIVHIHQDMALPGVKLPGEAELRAAAIGMAVKTTGNSADELDVLLVEAHALEPGMRYKIDVEKKCLAADN